MAGVGTAATGIGAAATPFLEGVAGAAKGVEFAASMLGSGTELDDALRDLYGAAQTIAKREKINPAQVAAAVRNLRGAPMVRANRGLVSNTDLADSNYVAALEHTLQSQRKLPRRRSGAPPCGFFRAPIFGILSGPCGGNSKSNWRAPGPGKLGQNQKSEPPEPESA